jgi:amino acid transporter
MDLAGSLGAVGLAAMAASASSPLTVLVGGIPTMLAATGLVGVGLVFALLAVGLLPATVAIVAAVRHIRHAATMYALAAQGLGRVAGVAAGAVALVSYVAIGTSLYGLVGFVGAATPLGWPWWVFALAVWAAVAVLGFVRLTASVAVIAVGVVVQLAVVGAVGWAALSRAPGGVSVSGLAPSGLLVGGAAGVAGALAFGIAAFIGFESAASYVEETRTQTAASRATVAALACLGVAYTMAAWTVVVGYGGLAVDAARDPGSGMPLALLGSGWATVAVVVLVLAIAASATSFHHLVALYMARLAQDGVLPSGLGHVRSGTGAPIAAARLQSAVSLGVIVVVAATGIDPFGGLFVPASTLAAVGVVSLLTAGSWAAGRYFARGGGAHEGRLVRLAAPVAGVAGAGTVLAVTVTHLDRLLGVAPGAASTRILPAVVVVAALVGAARGLWLRRRRPDVYEQIGRGAVSQAARRDPRLAKLAL